MRPVKEIGTVLASQNYSINNIICDTMKKFKFKTMCHKSGIQKLDGYSATEILTLLIMLPLMAFMKSLFPDANSLIIVIKTDK